MPFPCSCSSVKGRVAQRAMPAINLATLASSNKKPKNVNVVDGPSTLDDFTGAFILLQREPIAMRMFIQLLR